MEKIPNLMSEIIAFVTKNFTSIRFVKLSDGGCILCGTCIDSCKQGVIKYTFSRGV
jgi:ferredoxin